MESTGDYQEEVAEYLIKEGFTVSVINPFQSKAFAGSQLLRTKNDKVDAGLLARSKIKEHINKSTKLKHQFDLLKSIDGIGYKTAWEILAEIHIEDGESLNVKAQVAHGGLAPREFQSGKSVNKKPRICRTGNSKLRKALYMPAMTAMRKNSVLSEFYQRLVKSGKPKKVALIAVMRKLLVIAIGVLRNDRPFDPNWAKSQQEKYLLCA